MKSARGSFAMAKISKFKSSLESFKEVMYFFGSLAVSLPQVSLPIGEALINLTNKNIFQQQKQIPLSTLNKAAQSPLKLLATTQPTSVPTIYEHIGWAMGAPTDQMISGPCTAYALAGLVQTQLMARHGVRVDINPQSFWESYQTPSIISAFAAAQRKDSKLIATVKDAPTGSRFVEGSRVKITLRRSDVQQIRMEEIPDKIRAGFPVMMSSVFDSTVMKKGYAGEQFLAAKKYTSDVGHALYISGVSAWNPKTKTGWIHIRNSWGKNWGRNGSASLDARHCALNVCHFFVVKDIHWEELPSEPAKQVSLLNHPLIRSLTEEGVADNVGDPVGDVDDEIAHATEDGDLDVEDFQDLGDSALE